MSKRDEKFRRRKMVMSYRGRVMLEEMDKNVNKFD
jgi:hypothetical protein